MKVSARTYSSIVVSTHVYSRENQSIRSAMPLYEVAWIPAFTVTGR